MRPNWGWLEREKRILEFWKTQTPKYNICEIPIRCLFKYKLFTTNSFFNGHSQIRTYIKKAKRFEIFMVVFADITDWLNAERSIITLVHFSIALEDKLQV